MSRNGSQAKLSLEHTCAREVAQVQPRGRNLRHDGQSPRVSAEQFGQLKSGKVASRVGKLRMVRSKEGPRYPRLAVIDGRVDAA